MATLRILVAEDDPMIGDLLADRLRALGHVVCGIATTEDGAVVAAKLHRPGLLLVDVRLGDGSGVAAIHAILPYGLLPHVFTSGAPVDDAGVGAILLRESFLDADLVLAIRCATDTASSSSLGAGHHVAQRPWIEQPQRAAPGTARPSPPASARAWPRSPKPAPTSTRCQSRPGRAGKEAYAAHLDHAPPEAVLVSPVGKLDDARAIVGDRARGRSPPGRGWPPCGSVVQP